MTARLPDHHELHHREHPCKSLEEALAAHRDCEMGYIGAPGVNQYVVEIGAILKAFGVPFGEVSQRAYRLAEALQDAKVKQRDRLTANAKAANPR